MDVHEEGEARCRRAAAGRARMSSRIGGQQEGGEREIRAGAGGRKRKRASRHRRDRQREVDVPKGDTTDKGDQWQEDIVSSIMEFRSAADLNSSPSYRQEKFANMKLPLSRPP